MTAVLMTFSFKDPEVLQYLRTQENRSGYISGLIRQDMQRKSMQSEDMDTKIRRIVSEMMQHFQFDNHKNDITMHSESIHHNENIRHEENTRQEKIINQLKEFL